MKSLKVRLLRKQTKIDLSNNHRLHAIVAVDKVKTNGMLASDGTAYASYLISTYRLSVEEYNARYRLQGGGCAICKRVSIGKRLVVDHCHKTGRVRGLLCMRCNTAIGMLGDDIEVLARAIGYLSDD